VAKKSLSALDGVHTHTYTHIHLVAPTVQWLAHRIATSRSWLQIQTQTEKKTRDGRR